MRAPDFDEIVKNKFNFLTTEYNFKLSKCSKEDWGGYDIVYLSKTTGVQIIYEFREAYIFILFYRLIEGKLVKNPIVIKQDSILNGFSLDDLISIRNPSDRISPAIKYGSESIYYDEKEGLTRYVSDFADNVKKHATDILRGDFDVFDQLDKIVKSRLE